ncbi:MAG: hypothetical protein KAR64_09655, partial [Thermoplasmatales archaeon]|nr:hypothetical protein [Thermoplasmatales archaeon]
MKNVTIYDRSTLTGEDYHMGDDTVCHSDYHIEHHWCLPYSFSCLLKSVYMEELWYKRTKGYF